MTTCGTCGHEIRWDINKWIHTDNGSAFCHYGNIGGIAFPAFDPEV